MSITVVGSSAFDDIETPVDLEKDCWWLMYLLFASCKF